MPLTREEAVLFAKLADVQDELAFEAERKGEPENARRWREFAERTRAPVEAFLRSAFPDPGETVLA